MCGGGEVGVPKIVAKHSILKVKPLTQREQAAFQTQNAIGTFFRKTCTLRRPSLGTSGAVGSCLRLKSYSEISSIGTTGITTKPMSGKLHYILEWFTWPFFPL